MGHRSIATVRPSFPQPGDPPPGLAYEWRRRGVWLLAGNASDVLDDLAAGHPDGLFDCVFADPPYFLSNGGISCRSGRVVSVDKGAWDRSSGFEADHAWNLGWLRRCRDLLLPDGTLWVTGTHHNIFSVGYALRELGMKILNQIAWEKPDPPPNLSRRYFTHSTETLIWAAKSERSVHRFDFEAMREIAGGEPMRTVWRIAPPGSGEKRFGKHPTQKPLELVRRCLLSSTAKGDLVLDPFVGSGTTAVAALRAGLRCVGIDREPAALSLAARRLRHADAASAPNL
jgi:site-specific DNA-methyltransferase (adenine-specific)